jgi:hypothetical protein
MRLQGCSGTTLHYSGKAMQRLDTMCTSCAYFCLSCSLLLYLYKCCYRFCYMQAHPYISKRLLTDESPRLRAALRYMIYGNSNVFDVERLIDLLQAFESFAEIRDDKVTFFFPSKWQFLL